MAIILDATVGGISSNTYSTLAVAETYHEARLDNTAWTGATNDKKNRALATATRLLDEWIWWNGSSNTSTQALQWPRYDVLDRHGVEYSALIIPVFLRDATAEFAMWLLATDRTADPDTLGVAAITAGPVGITVNPYDRRHVIPDAVASMVKFAGHLRLVKPHPKLVRA